MWHISRSLIPTLRILRCTSFILKCWLSRISLRLSLAMACGSLHGTIMDSCWWPTVPTPRIWIHTKAPLIINGLCVTVRKSTHGQLCSHTMSDIASSCARTTHLTWLIWTCLSIGCNTHSCNYAHQVLLVPSKSHCEKLSLYHGKRNAIIRQWLRALLHTLYM